MQFYAVGSFSSQNNEPAIDGEEKAILVCKEVARVLKPGGILLLFSCMPSAIILKVVAKREYGWRIRAQKIGEKKEVLFLVIRKELETSK